MAENKGFSLKTFGMPWWLAGAIAVIVIAAAATHQQICYGRFPRRQHLERERYSSSWYLL